MASEALQTGMACEEVHQRTSSGVGGSSAARPAVRFVTAWSCAIASLAPSSISSFFSFHTPATLLRTLRQRDDVHQSSGKCWRGSTSDG